MTFVINSRQKAVKVMYGLAVKPIRNANQIWNAVAAINSGKKLTVSEVC